MYPLYFSNVLTRCLSRSLIKNFYPNKLNVTKAIKISNKSKFLNVLNRLYVTDNAEPMKWLTFTFCKATGEKFTVKGKEQDTLLDIIVNNNLEFDGFGACEGGLSCSTCHVIFKEEDFKKLHSQPIAEEEYDMLEVAPSRSNTSRLGCQVALLKELDGVEVLVPEEKSDIRDF